MSGLKNRFAQFQCCFFVALFLWLGSSELFAQVKSIEEFMTFQEKWKNFVASEYEWTIEGRYSGIADSTMTFTNCPLPFRLKSEHISARGITGVVEVVGRIVQEEKGLAFRVEKLTTAPRDLDRLKGMESTIPVNQPDKWYQVAGWARNRSAFYNDRELLAGAAEVEKKGVLAELRNADPLDQMTFAAALKKAEEKGLDPTVRQQYLYNSFVKRLEDLRTKPFSEPAFQSLLAQIGARFPASLTKISTYSEEVNQNYIKHGKEAYAVGSAEERNRLERLLAIDIISSLILQGAQADGSNGFSIADKVRQEIPERTDLESKYEELGTTWYVDRLPKLTQSQLQELTARLEKYGTPEQVVDVKTSWLLSREAAYRQEGARGLDDFAQQWLSLLNNSEMAYQLYVEAWRLNPEYPPAIAWLKSRGYRLVNQSWISEEELANMPLSPIEQAVRDGRVEIGMTAAQVQAALGVAPSSLTRSASRKVVSEWWVYKGAAIVVRLEKKGFAAESIVVGITDLNESQQVAPSDPQNIEPAAKP
ncbi:hypothetical protein SH668x_000222 [Planctomicrobium sp. SH668]|uniref:hypothetical protein n=1 Tax=Planctomicrobium sp. SH668 TaxID=3448126 RepID=UPI003F5BB527